MKKEQQQGTTETEPTRKHYNRPTLVEYGTVAKLTRGGGSVLTADRSFPDMAAICL